MSIDRRELLEQLALLVAGLSACRRPEGEADASRVAPPAADAGSGWKEGEHALAPLQRAALAAAIARILPSDDGPGAAEAGVIEYLDRELARPEYGAIKVDVLAGLTALNNFSKRGGAKVFTELSPEEQDFVLHQVQNASERGKAFLFILTNLTLEGFFGDPRWGGNQGEVGWRWIGYGPAMSGEGGHEH